MIEIVDKDVWAQELMSMNHDFHVLFESQDFTDELNQPVLLKFTHNEKVILLPLIKRKINNSEYCDFTSVYGYAGPMVNFNCCEDELITLYQKLLLKYFKEQKTVSVFSRFHPLLDQKNILNGFGEIINLSNTVSIDLTLPLNEQRKQFRKGVKSDLSKLRKRKLIVEEVAPIENIDAFISIYNENMDRVGATDNYYFSKVYYENLFGSKSVDARLFFVFEKGIPISASIFVFTKKIIQYHLSGTRTNHLQNSPVRLLLDHVRELGTNLGFEYLHLGGGVGASEDALFNFKAGFSKVRHDFSVWKFIVDIDKYSDLVESSGINFESDFFPLYRALD